MLGLPPWEQRSIFHEARFQPLLQHLFVSGDVIEHPSVADVIEAATDVTLQHPLGAVSQAHNIEALL
jgi:hypothetical protein